MKIEELLLAAFTARNGRWFVKPAHRQGVQLLRQELHQEVPPGRFDVVLCRNLAFTYFALALQEAVLERIATSLSPQGLIVIGSHEHLPGEMARWRSVGDNCTILALTS